MNLNDLTKKEISNMIKHITPIANAKLKSVRDKGLENYNQSFIKKYNILTNQKVNYNIATKRGYFRKGVTSYTKNGKKHEYTKDELIRRYEAMEEFVNNYYASAEYTEQHLQELSERWGLKDKNSVKSLFNLYREYGYDNYKDSDAILTSMAKITSDAEMYIDNGQLKVMTAGEYLEHMLETIEGDIDNIENTRAVTEGDYIKALQEKAHILK